MPLVLTLAAHTVWGRRTGGKSVVFHPQVGRVHPAASVKKKDGPEETNEKFIHPSPASYDPLSQHKKEYFFSKYSEHPILKRKILYFGLSTILH